MIARDDDARKKAIEGLINQVAIATEKMNETLLTLGEKSALEIEELLSESAQLDILHKLLARRVAFLTPKRQRLYLPLFCRLPEYK